MPEEKEEHSTAGTKDSMTSEPTVTVDAGESTLSIDAGVRQYKSKLMKTAGFFDDDPVSKSRPKGQDQRRSISRNYSRSLGATDLEGGNREKICIPPIRADDRESMAQVIRSSVEGPDSVEKEHTTQRDSKSLVPTLSLPSSKDNLQRSDHSEASTMGASHVMQSINDVKQGIVLDFFCRKAKKEASSRNHVNKQSRVSDKDKHLDGDGKKRTIITSETIPNDTDTDLVINDNENSHPNSFGWKRLIQDIHCSPNRKYPADKAKSLTNTSMMPEYTSNLRVEERRTQAEEAPISRDPMEVRTHPLEDTIRLNTKNQGGAPDVDKDSTKWNALSIRLPPMDWQDKKNGLKGSSQSDQELPRASPKIKVQVSHSNQNVVNKNNEKEERLKIVVGSKLIEDDSGRKQLLHDKESINDENTPFSSRPAAAGPFALRPTWIPQDVESPVAKSSEISTATISNETDDGLVNDDEKSVQSVDRHLIRESSRRRLLRQEVAERRESLQSMLKVTKNQSLPMENQVLSLKRKLALSQALVERLELDKQQIRRQAVLDVACAQMAQLNQRKNREKELERQIKKLMEERNAAIDECHRMRAFIMCSCDQCKSRIDEGHEYFMDHFERNTILSQHTSPKSSVFEWFIDTLSTEALHLEFKTTTTSDNENIFIAGTETEAATHLSTAPLDWLSERLFAEQEIDLDTGTTIQCVTSEHVDNSTDNCEAMGVSFASQPIISIHEQTHNVVPILAAYNPESQKNPKLPMQNIVTEQPSQSTKRKKGFFASLLGEKVVDEFSVLDYPVATTDANFTPQKNYSFFGNLRREEIQEEVSQSLDSITEKRNGTPINFDFGLKNERFVDDMALIDSLAMVIEEYSRIKLGSGIAERRSFSKLQDEMVRDDFVLNHTNHSVAHGRPKNVLRDEVVDVRRHDDRMLGLNYLSKSKEDHVNGSSRLMNEEYRKDRVKNVVQTPSLPGGTQQEPRNTIMESDQTKQPPDEHILVASGLSSPFSWKRNPCITRRDMDSVPKYLWKYRSKSHCVKDESRNDDKSHLSSETVDMIFPSTTSTLVSDLKQRPWKIEAQEKPSNPCLQIVEDPIMSDDTSQHDSTTELVDEISDVEILMERESSKRK